MLKKNEQEIVSRCLILNCLIACSSGFASKSAQGWLEKNNLVPFVSNDEANVFSGATSAKTVTQKIEGLWVLVWCLGKVNNLDFSEYCGNNLSNLLPNLAKDEGIERFVSKIKLRDTNEIIQTCDLSYCLHWAVTNAKLNKVKNISIVQSYVIIERRRALEWLISEEQWDDIVLDT